MRSEIPQTRYAVTIDGVHIAYQVLGAGPLDLIYLAEWISNVELQWEEPRHERFLRGLASRARLITIDRRGTGLSDRIAEDTPVLEASMDDLLAVMAALEIERAVVFGVLEGACAGALFGATYPERTAGLILFGAFARGLAAPDYPSAWSEQRWRDEDALVEEHWGTPGFSDDVLRYTAPTNADDPALRRWWAEQTRRTMSPAAALAINHLQRDIDVRTVLPTIQVPTLVLHRTGDRVSKLDEGRYVAEAIPGALFVELDGEDHPPWAGDQDAVLIEVERFLASIRDVESDFERVLTTVLFTDIVDSTAQSAAIGDREWAEIRTRHDRVVRTNIARFRGREVKTMGDGFLAIFDGPARGVRCAKAIADGVRPLGIEIRAGLHTGEVTLDGTDVTGIGVAIGARIGGFAGRSEVLVSQTVKDLVVGSGLAFADAGEHELKGVPERWRLYRVVDERRPL